MKNNIKKSSITLPPQELKLVKRLMLRLKAKSKVEVIRRGLYLLKAKTERQALKEAYVQASLMTRKNILKEMGELDHLSNEGLEDES